MKTTLLVTSLLLLSLGVNAQEKVNLHLPATKSETIGVGKGFMLTGAFMCLGSAFLVTNNSGGKAPQAELFALGVAAHTTGMVVYTMGKKR